MYPCMYPCEVFARVLLVCCSCVLVCARILLVCIRMYLYVTLYVLVHVYSCGVLCHDRMATTSCESADQL